MNKKSDLKFVTVIFMASTLLFGLLSMYPKVFMIYNDEIGYIDLPRSILRDGSFTVQNCYKPFQKLFYSLCLVPALLIKNSQMQIVVAGWINSILMSSMIFPVFMFSKELFGDILIKKGSIKKSRAFILTIMLLPIVAYTQFFMSENAFFPLSLWILWLMYRYVLNEDNNYSIKINIILGILFYLAYFCKEAALYYLAAYAVFEVKQLVNKKRQSKKAFVGMLISLVVFAVIFLITKFTVFSGMGNSYNQQDLESVFSVKQFAYIFYAAIYMLIFTILAFGVIPVFLPLRYYSKMTKQDKNLFFISCFIVVIVCISIAYSISVREDYLTRSPKLVLRYLEMFIVPYLFLLFKYGFCNDNVNEKDNIRFKKSVLIWGIAFVVIVCANGSRLSDNMLLRYYYIFNQAVDSVILPRVGNEAFIINEIINFIVRFVVVVVMYNIGVRIVRDGEKVIKTFLVILIVLGIIGTVSSIAISYVKYRVPKEYVNEMSDFNDKLNVENNKGVMICAGDELSKKLIDTYIDYPAFVLDSNGNTVFEADYDKLKESDIIYRVNIVEEKLIIN